MSMRLSLPTQVGAGPGEGMGDGDALEVVDMKAEEQDGSSRSICRTPYDFAVSRCGQTKHRAVLPVSIINKEITIFLLS